jgi:GDP-L-fucose synthase
MVIGYQIRKLTQYVVANQGSDNEILQRCALIFMVHGGRLGAPMLTAMSTRHGEIMILVTGATGFLGKRVCHKLAQSSMAFTRTSHSLGVDLRDYDQTLAAFAAVRPATVLNCASYAGGIQFGVKYPADVFRHNMAMIANLFEAAHQTGVKRIVNPLANCVYPAHLTVFEETKFWDGPLHESVMVYGLLRKLSWAGSWAYSRQWGLQTINLVLSNMYGPEEYFDEERSHAVGGLIRRFIEAKESGAPEVVVWGSGAPIREWLYVDDGAEAMVRGIKCAPCDEPINVGVKNGVTISDLAERIRSLVNYNGRIVYDKTKPDGAPHKTVDGSRGKALLGWGPQVELNDGLLQTVKWYVESRRRTQAPKGLPAGRPNVWEATCKNEF